MESQEFYHRLPKVELHAHINGSISEDTIKKLLKKKGREEEGANVRFNKEQTEPLEDSFKRLKLMQTLSNCAEDIYIITCDVIQEFASDNVKYLELRSTPREITATGLTRELYVEAVLKAIKDSAHLDIIVRFLLSIDRRLGVDVARTTMELAERYQDISNGVVMGLDFSGDPKVGDARDYLPLFIEAHNRGLKLTLHLAEVPAPEETKDILKELGTRTGRIGHGTCLQTECGGNQTLVDLVLQHRIPLELCLTSNVKGQTVPNYDQHQFQFWYNKNHPCIIGTDDKGMFDTTLSEEHAITAQTCELDKESVWNLSLASIDAIFADDDVKHTLRNKWH
ncbi:adenosine deaminase-like protein isoform X2 [Mizuhopecten yessoensis]|uniref:adenosine deaminase-like protein isoform X2 n=1 Tax=Mizuhopecten yessoensis TaxID=6573 RepID=UPI000B45D1F2|nr:adenosine deaminase-like protein isoform X2 [Mizuhopecten yessoensis]